MSEVRTTVPRRSAFRWSSCLTLPLVRWNPQSDFWWNA